MSTCKYCHRGGLFFKTDINDLCAQCAPKVIRIVEAWFASYQRFLEIAKRPTLGLSKRLRHLEKAIELMHEMHISFETRGIHTTDPPPSTVLKELTELKQHIITENLAPYPDGIRYIILSRSNDMDAYRLSRKYEDEIVNHNVAGRELEKQGRVDEAIQHYQAAVALCPDTPFPYDRLRIIYTRQQEYKQAIAICRQYITDGKRAAKAIRKELGDKELAQTQLSDHDKWKQWIEKIKAKQQSTKRK